MGLSKVIERIIRPITVDSVSNAIEISNSPNSLLISKGDVAGYSYIHKFGNAPDFDESDNEVTVWSGADDAGINEMTYVYSSSAAIDSLSSSDDTDTQDVEVQGLDTNWNMVIQTVTLTGQTRKALNTSLRRVFRMKNVGSTDFAGNIYCYENGNITAGIPDDTATVRAVVKIGENQTLMAVYTIPNGKTGYMRDWYAATAGGSKDSNYKIKLRTRPFGKVFQTKHAQAIADVGTSSYQHRYQEPEKFVAKTDIEMTAEMLAGGGSGASITAGFDLVLIDD